MCGECDHHHQPTVSPLNTWVVVLSAMVGGLSGTVVFFLFLLLAHHLRSIS